MADIRSTFVQTLVEEAASDSRITAVINDSLSASNLSPFKAQFPERLYNVGIAEQNMVGFGTGLAAVGLIPWVCSATCFLSFRSLEQIRNDVVYARQNVKLVGNTSGVDYGSLGTTHHSLEDVSILRALPGLSLIIPADHEETAQAVRTLLQTEGPAYLRLYRGEVPESLGMEGRFEPGKVRVLRKGTDCVVYAVGRMVHRALGAADALASEGISVGVVNVSSLSPLDVDGIAAAASGARCVVTVEEHSVLGGLGGAVCEVLSEHLPRPVRRLGFHSFSIPGPAEELRKHYGLTAEGIASSVRTLVQQVS